MLATIVRDSDFWRFQPHPEVWLLVAFVVGAYVYAIRVIGPSAVRPGEPIVTKAQLRWFTGGALLLWLASDWPLHDIAEEYLYSAHMLQHMSLSYFMPAMMVLATPTWLARILIGDGRVYAVVRWVTKPVPAALAFNTVTVVTHIPGVVNESIDSAFVHYSLHVLLVTVALVMWMPICGPLPEVRISYGGQMIYLFALSVVPTVPAGWLTFAEGIVYRGYDVVPRMWGVSPTADQQFAGLIMKVGGSVFLWTLIAYLFFRRFAGNWEAQTSYRRLPRSSAALTGIEQHPLVFEEVAHEFERAPAPAEPTGAS